MKGRQVTFAYSIMVLVLCCGYSEPNNGILLSLPIIPSVVLVVAALYSVYWFQRHQYLSFAVLFGAFLKANVLSYICYSFNWYRLLRTIIGPIMFEFVLFSIATVLTVGVFFLMRNFKIFYRVLGGLLISSVLTESSFVFLPKSTVVWVPYLIYALCSLVSIGFVIGLGDKACKIFIPVIAAYTITLAIYIQHMKSIFSMDAEVFPNLDAAMASKEQPDLKYLKLVWDKREDLKKIAKPNVHEKVYRRVLEHLLKDINSPVESLVKKFKENYKNEFPKFIFSKRFYFIFFVLLSILLGMIAFINSRRDKSERQPSELSDRKV